jgi:hypothetical protein
MRRRTVLPSTTSRTRTALRSTSTPKSA